MVVGFTTTYMCMQSVPITINVVSSNPAQARCTRYSIMFFQWLAKGRKISPGTSFSSTNKTDRHDIAEILLKVALNTITLTPNPMTYILRILSRLHPQLNRPSRSIQIHRATHYPYNQNCNMNAFFSFDIYQNVSNS